MTQEESRQASAEEKGGFAELAARQSSTGPLGEFFYFLRRTRKWWMLLVIVPLFLVGALLVLGTTAAAPLIYALF